MKRVALGVVAVWLVFVGARWGCRAFTPLEERIRSALEQGCEDFSEGETGDALLLFADGFQATPSGIDREELWEAFRYLQLISLNRGGWPYAARLGPESLDVEVAEDGVYAEVDVVLELEERTPADRTELWRVRVEGAMAEVDGRWQWVSATHTDLEGHRFR